MTGFVTNVLHVPSAFVALFEQGVYVLRLCGVTPDKNDTTILRLEFDKVLVGGKQTPTSGD